MPQCTHPHPCRPGTMLPRTGSEPLTTAQAAAILGVHRSQVVRLIGRRALPAHWFGSLWILEESWVRAYAAERTAVGAGRG